jgi:hypothetical protein
MTKFSTNLGFLFTELAFLDRFAGAVSWRRVRLAL